MMLRIIGAMLLVAASVMATPVVAAMSAVNPAPTQNLAARPKAIVRLPSQVSVFEPSGGGVATRMAGREATARSNVTASATRLVHDAGLFQRLPTPPLTPADLDTLDAHIGLYDPVAQPVFIYGRDEQAAWAYEKNGFDDTVGPGESSCAARASPTPR